MRNLLFATLPILMINLAFSSTKTASITVHSHSFQVNPLDWKDGDISYFTTFDGKTGQPLGSNGEGFTGEFKPSSKGSLTYRSDFVEATNGIITSYGTLSVEIPSDDSDSNGFPDFLQKAKAVNTSLTLISETQWDSEGDYLSPTVKVLFKRSADSNSGTYQLTDYGGSDISSYNLAGYWNIGTWTGEVTYGDQNNLSINLNRTMLFEPTESATASGTYVVSDQKLSLSQLSIVRDFSTIKSYESELQLTESAYSGLVELEDGEPETSWKDFESWQVFITDTNDYDSDGIPDLTDPESTSSGNDETKSSSYIPPTGWYWFGAYPWAYSYLENGWLYCRPASDGLYMYSVQNKTWSLYPHQN